ncbi:MAG: LAGLIDADG family homing endonuclease [Candidatus Aenigmatarchaeota archaeon]
MVDSKLATLYGIMLGDGCLSNSCNKYFISISGSFYDDEPFFNKVVIPIFSKIRGKQTKYRKRPKQGKIEINISDKKMFLYLKSLGFPVGRKLDRIFIPKIFYEKGLVKFVISGVFATDGSLVITNNNGIPYPRLEITSKCLRFLNQIKNFLMENKMKGNVYRNNRKNGLIYRLEFPGKNNLEKFIELIGFINPKHVSKHNTFKCAF